MKRETLEIVVADQSVQWTLRSAESDVKLGSDVFKLQVTDTQVKTINLLVSLQRLLADTARQKWVLPTDWTPDTINEAVYGLTEMAGEQLYGVLFQNPTLANILTNAISRIDDGSLELLRLELEFRGKNDLSADWPWEYLRTPKAMGGESEGKFLAIYTDLVLSRTITVQNPRPLRIDGTPRVLLVVARPKELSVVEADDVIETLKQLDADKKIELLQLVEPLHEMFDQPPFIVTLETVRQQIKSFQPHLVHFIGHGENRQIVGHKEKYGHLAFLDKDSGNSVWVSGEDFASIVLDGNPYLRLVFLQACESALPDPQAGASSVAMQLATRSISAVIAMQAKIENLVANTFARNFYTFIQQGQPVDLAVKEARKAIKNLAGNAGSRFRLAFGVPVLYLRGIDSLMGTVASDMGKGRFTACPRCKSIYIENDFCTVCGLRFNCNHCNKPLLSPLDSRYCSGCRQQVDQPPWTPPVSTPTRDQTPRMADAGPTVGQNLLNIRRSGP